MQSLRIYSSDPFIRELNEEASLKLNHRAMVVFKKLEKNMQLHPDGVLEKFKDNGEKIYTVRQDQCVIAPITQSINLLVVT